MKVERADKSAFNILSGALASLTEFMLENHESLIRRFSSYNILSDLKSIIKEDLYHEENYSIGRGR